MFTIEQIKAAHSKVKSGADFPAFIQDIKKLGVIYYKTLVANGNTEYYGADHYKVASGAGYDALIIAGTSNADQFWADLKAHQQGKTDFPTFCNNCAETGIAEWVVDTEKMSCTYYDKAGNEILVEQIPE